MPDPREQLIDAALRDPGGDVESRLAAGHELAEHIRMVGTLTPAGAAAMIDRWAEVDAGRKKFLRPRALAVLLVLGVLAVIVINLREIALYRFLWNPVIFHAPDHGDWAMVNFAEREKSGPHALLLLGSHSEHLYGQSSEDLWMSDPRNPAYYAEHVARTLGYSGVLPPDVLATAENLDPENAWFPYLVASRLVIPAVEKNSPSKAEMAGGTARYWTIKDPAALDRAIALADEAGRMPRYQSYRGEMATARIPLLRHSNRVDYCISLAGIRAREVSLLALDLGFSAKAEELASAGNTPEFRNLLRSAETYLQKRLTRENLSLEDIQGIEKSMIRTYHDLETAASSLGMEDEATRLKGMSDRLAKRTRDNAAKFGGYAGFPSDIVAAQTLHVPIIPNVSELPEIPNSARAPGHHGDHALAWRILSFWMALLFGVCMALLGSQRFLVPKLVSRTGRRIHLLLAPADYGRIFVTGMLLPVCYFFCISRFTPFGGRERGVSTSFHLIPFFQCVAMFLMIAISTLLACRRSLARRAEGLLPAQRTPWPGWAALGILAAFLPLIGWMNSWKFEKHADLIAPAVMLFLPLAWLVTATLGSPFAGQARRLEAAALRPTLISAYACAGLWMLCLAQLFKIEEDYWFRNHDIIRLEAKYGGTRYEYELAQQMRAELREAAGL